MKRSRPLSYTAPGGRSHAPGERHRDITDVIAPRCRVYRDDAVRYEVDRMLDC